MATKGQSRRSEKSLRRYARAFDRITEPLEAALLAMLAARQATDVYWRRIRPAFSPGPALLVIAARQAWPFKPVQPTSVECMALATPIDSERAVIGPLITHPALTTDLSLMAGVYLATLEGLRAARMKRVQYDVAPNDRYTQRLLGRMGFRPGPDDPHGPDDPDDPLGGAPYDASIDDIIGGCGFGPRPKADDVVQPGSLGDTPGADPFACFLSNGQLGGPRRQPGRVGPPVPGEGISPWADSPDGGTPPPSDGGSEPGVPPDPAPAPDPPDGGPPEPGTPN